MIAIHRFRRAGAVTTSIGKCRVPRAFTSSTVSTNSARSLAESHNLHRHHYNPATRSVNHIVRIHLSSSPPYRYWMESSHRTCHAPQSNCLSTFTKSEYIHPLSQIVLEHLQSCHSHWVTEMGLDTGLKLNEDGTFLLRFPIAGCNGVTIEDDGTEEGSDEDMRSANNGSIWTMYEPTENKHYLCVTKGGLVGRYMLQDNTKPAWHTDKRSTPERVQDAVDEMIIKMQETGTDDSKS